MFAAALTTKVLFSIINNTLYLFAGGTSVDKKCIAYRETESLISCGFFILILANIFTSVPLGEALIV